MSNLTPYEPYAALADVYSTAGFAQYAEALAPQIMQLAFDQDWMDLARPMIEERMQQYEGNQIQFNLLALCKSPLVSIPAELATNINTLTAV